MPSNQPLKTSAALLYLAAGSATAGIDQSSYGTTADGVEVHRFTLSNSNGMSVRFLDMGGVITEVNLPDRRAGSVNVVLGLGSLPAYRATTTMNALIGRFANRLRNGFTLDGTHYTLSATASGVTLHGGSAPYGVRLWHTATASKPRASAVTLSLVSHDGDQGFPGNLTLAVTYTLTDDDELRIDYDASTDKPTVVNLTNHLYFNLAGNGSGTIYAQRLQVLADEYTPVDDDLVPTGVLAPVAGTPFDFREPHAIGERITSSEPQMIIGRGYDHNFVLRQPAGDSAAAAEPRIAARLFDPASGRRMELRTTEPGLQVYSSNLMTGALVSAVGATLRQGAGLALETQHFPNSPNVAAFPSTVLRPGEHLHSVSVYRFYYPTRHISELHSQDSAT